MWVVPDAVQIYAEEYQTQNKHVKDFAKIFINGTMNVNVNKNLFKHVQTYISDTNRFM